MAEAAGFFCDLWIKHPLVVGAGGGGSYHTTFEPGASSRIGGNGKVELSPDSAGATHNASGGAGTTVVPFPAAKRVSLPALPAAERSDGKK